MNNKYVNLTNLLKDEKMLKLLFLNSSHIFNNAKLIANIFTIICILCTYNLLFDIVHWQYNVIILDQINGGIANGEILFILVFLYFTDCFLFVVLVVFVTIIHVIIEITRT